MRILLIFLLLLSVPCAHADPVSRALKTGGVVLLMRHATAPGNLDPAQFKLDDCSTQRNLSGEGRDEARRIGAHLRKLGLVPGEVLTSQWCRCRETAQLAFGRGADWPPLNSNLRNEDVPQQEILEVFDRIAKTGRRDKPLVLVTHQSVVTALTGLYPQSGEIIVVAPLRGAGKSAPKSADRSSLRIIGNIYPASIK